MNIGVHMSVWDSACNYFGHTPTSGIAGYILLSFWMRAIIWKNGYRPNSRGVWKAMHFRGKWKQELSILISYTFASIRRAGHFIRALRNWRNCVSPQSTCWSQVGNQQRFSAGVTDKQGRQSPQRKPSFTSLPVSCRAGHSAHRIFFGKGRSRDQRVSADSTVRASSFTWQIPWSKILPDVAPNPQHSPTDTPSSSHLRPAVANSGSTDGFRERL